MNDANIVTVHIRVELEGYEEIGQKLNELVEMLEKANSLVNELANSELKITTVLDRR